MFDISVPGDSAALSATEHSSLDVGNQQAFFNTAVNQGLSPMTVFLAPSTDNQPLTVSVPSHPLPRDMGDLQSAPVQHSRTLSSPQGWSPASVFSNPGGEISHLSLTQYDLPSADRTNRAYDTASSHGYPTSVSAPPPIASASTLPAASLEQAERSPGGLGSGEDTGAERKRRRAHSQKRVRNKKKGKKETLGMLMCGRVPGNDNDFFNMSGYPFTLLFLH